MTCEVILGLVLALNALGWFAASRMTARLK